jgi:hypothetical protein
VHVLDTIAPTVVYADPSEIWVQCFYDVPEFVVEFADNCDDSLTIEGISGIAQDGCELKLFLAPGLLPTIVVTQHLKVR